MGKNQEPRTENRRKENPAVGVAERVEDAVLLWQNGRHKGALLMALVAVAATARRRYATRARVGDREPFERFLQSARSVRLDVEFRGELQPIEHIFYKWFRCELVHEGDVPYDIDFIDSEALEVRAGGAPEYVLKVSNGWFNHFIGAVVTAPENAGLFHQNELGAQ
jgi:hypothetical protein